MVSLGRRAVACLLCAQMSGVCLAGRNLITNFDHRERQGIDLPMGWTKHIRHKLVTTLDVQPQADGSVRFIATGEPWALYEQRNLKLVPGAKYRLSYEVKTAGLDGAPVHVLLHDSKWSWQSPQTGPNFPDDTKGAWVKQEAVLTMCDHPGATEHTLTISCIHGKAVGKVDFLLRDLRLEAMDEATDRASEPIGAVEREKLVARIVPVDPLLSNVNADDARMTFYWPGVAACGITRCQLVSRFKGKQYNKPVVARFDEKGYATVRYGRIWPSKYEIEAVVIDDATNRLAKNEYKIAVKRPEKPVTAGRRLNNLVTELVDRPLENGEVVFSRATSGWVWMSFEGDVGTGAVGYLDDIAYPVVRYRDGENRIEAQRFVSAGIHTLRIVGAKSGGRLRINAVKTIWGQLPGLTTRPSSCYRIGFRYTLPFCNRFDIHTSMNTCAFKGGQHIDPVFAGFVYGRGMRTHVNVKANPDGPLYDDYAETWKKLTDSPWQCGYSIAVDENKVNQYPRRTVHYSEAAWKMLEIHPEQSIDLFYADTSFGNYYDCPQISASEISVTVNSGDGTGLLCPEMYATVRESPEDLDLYLDAYAKFVTSAQDIVPAARGKVVLYGASYVQIGDWSNYVAPGTDIKAHYSKMYRAFATDPRFEGCAGLGCGGQICGGEELLRWVAKCTRYYGLEGGTDDLAAKCGFSWSPGFVKNADMDEGLTNWTVKGEVEAERFRAYGAYIQKRQTVPVGYGDGVATFTTRADAPNELSQELSGLKTGRPYAVICCVADQDDIRNKGGATRGLKSPLAFSVRLEGATEFQNLRYETVSAVKSKVGMRLLRYVFRADSDKARLVFTDRKDDGTAAPEGFKQSLNYISFMPYYVESPDEPAEIASALGWTDANRIRDGR